MNMELAFERVEAHEALSALERVAMGILVAMIPIWLLFQVLEIGSLFPPIGVLYALGSIVVLGAMTYIRKPWAPVIATVWAAMMMIPESIPAWGHLLHWDEIYTHFGHYLIIMTFFPLAITLVVTGIAATVQNTRTAPAARQAPRWLRGLVPGVVALIVAGNAVTVILYAFDIV